MAETFEFKAEIQQLLNILIHSLYTEQEIFLRELMSNASDALNRFQFETLTNDNVLDPEAELRINVTADADAGTITITDTGIGMTREELITNLGTIAQSGATAFLKALKEQGDSAANIIGQFGVGFYSVFMVADQVQVTSRSFQPDAAAARWTCDGSASFTVEDAEKDSRGTEILITLKEDHKDFANDWRLRQIITRHSNYIAFPIYVGEPEDDKEPEPVNQQVAIWRQPSSEVTEDAYNDFYRQITFDFNEPQAYIHMQSEAPLDLHAILYVPSSRDRGPLAPKEHGLKLYSRKILIQERTADLLPEYLRFVEGVVDSEDLPLNVSRESVQANVIMRKIRNNLVRRLLKELASIAKDDPERYMKFWDEFGIAIKEGIATTQEDHKHLTKLLRFHSSKTGDEAWVSLTEYVERMNEGQDRIYFLFGEDLKSIKRSPHLDPFKASHTEVLFLTEPIDSFMMVTLKEFADTTFQNIADADIDLPDSDDEPEGEMIDGDLFNPLLTRFNQVLGERVVAVREAKHLTESPARLVPADDGPGADNMERVRKYLDEDFTMNKRVMEINRRHPLIKDMALVEKDAPMDPILPAMIDQLYENALLIEGIHPNPAEMVDRIQQIMTAAAAKFSTGDGDTAKA